MMQTAPILCLNSSQVTQLIAFCAVYRAHLWQQFQPTPERNQLIRAIQALEGRLEKAQDEATSHKVLSLSVGEKNALQQQLIELLRLYGKEPESIERNQRLAEIFEIRKTIEQMIHQPQAL
jgi:hypothetical protein